MMTRLLKQDWDSLCQRWGGGAEDAVSGNDGDGADVDRNEVDGAEGGDQEAASSAPAPPPLPQAIPVNSRVIIPATLCVITRLFIFVVTPAYKLNTSSISLQNKQEQSPDRAADANKLHALRYLLFQLLLHVLLGPGEYSETASELVMCCKKAFSISDIPESYAEDGLEVDTTPEWINVLVDTLLSLLPQLSPPMRSAIEQVIKKNLRPARHPDPESEDDDNDDDEEDFINIEDEEIDQAETGETGENDEQTDDSEAVVEAEETNKENPEASDDSDSGMDDDAMFRMVTYIAQIFKEKNQAGGKPQVLTVYSNLARVFVNPHTAEVSEQLVQRVWGILQKQIFKAKDHPRADDTQLSTLESLLERNLKLTSKPLKREKAATNPSKQSASWNRQKMVSSFAQNSTFWILKIIDSRNFSEFQLQRVFDIFRDVTAGYFDSKKSQIKSEFLKEIFRRRPWIGHNVFGFLLEKCGSAKSGFRRIEALDLVVEILKSLDAASTKDGDQNASRKIVKGNLPKLSNLMKELVINMPDKQSRRAEMQKFCPKTIQILSRVNLIKNFLKSLAPEVQAALESQLSEQFIK
ncbi:hypothetical protein L6164_036425 [Bauhinia variegata]|uniref:Uncharacterized protein n=1 Tax=Bauhinia variegata TaxID=167791 RepID=A0ACB9KGX1_BAUVA|nr:hypothetical protein L6164_036425 [Bauhinia variegata]